MTPKQRLDRLSDVRAEMARVYREARAGKVNINDGVRFCCMLSQIRAAIEAEVTERLEARLMTVEERLQLRVEAHHEARLN
jgi:hypothetical protein